MKREKPDTSDDVRRIRDAMKDCDLSQRDVASGTGLGVSTVNRVLSGAASYDSSRRVLRFLKLDESGDEAVARLHVLARRLANLGAHAQLAELIDLAEAQVKAAEKAAKAKATVVMLTKEVGEA